MRRARRADSLSKATAILSVLSLPGDGAVAMGRGGSGSVRARRRHLAAEPPATAPAPRRNRQKRADRADRREPSQPPPK